MKKIFVCVLICIGLLSCDKKSDTSTPPDNNRCDNTLYPIPLRGFSYGLSIQVATDMLTKTFPGAEITLDKLDSGDLVMALFHDNSHPTYDFIRLKFNSGVLVSFSISYSDGFINTLGGRYEALVGVLDKTKERYGDFDKNNLKQIGDNNFIGWEINGGAELSILTGPKTGIGVNYTCVSLGKTLSDNAKKSANYGF